MTSNDQDVLSELSDLIESLTTSGSQTLDENVFKRVKSICKSSDENVRHLYRMVMTQLEKRHSEIRLSSLQIINEIFLRSHAFRELLVDDFQKFLSLAIGVNSKTSLPEPQTGKFVSRNRDLGCATFSERAHRRAKFKNIASGAQILKVRTKK